LQRRAALPGKETPHRGRVGIAGNDWTSTKRSRSLCESTLPERSERMAERSGYSRLQIGLHWLIAVLILVAWLSAEGAEEAIEAIEDGGTAGFVPHVAFGLAVLTLVVLRLVMRVTRGVPAAPGQPGSLAVKAADWGHWLLYLLMIGVPLGGVSIWFFGMDNGDIHGLFANVVLIIALGHAGIALYHQYVLKDGLLRRMMRAE
jgi:cytochrome b561